MPLGRKFTLVADHGGSSVLQPERNAVCWIEMEPANAAAIQVMSSQIILRRGGDAA